MKYEKSYRFFLTNIYSHNQKLSNMKKIFCLIILILLCGCNSKENIKIEYIFQVSNDVNLRSKPNAKSKIIDVLKKDEIINVFDSINNWYVINYDDFNKGFVSKKYIIRVAQKFDSIDKPYSSNKQNILISTVLGIVLVILIIKILGKYKYNTLEKVLSAKKSKYKDCFWYLTHLLSKLKSGDIRNEEELNKNISRHYGDMFFSGTRGVRTKKNPQFFKNKQALYKELEEIFAIYLNNLEKNVYGMIINGKRIRIGISFEDAEQYHALTQKIHGILGDLFLSETSKKSKNKKGSRGARLFRTVDDAIAAKHAKHNQKDGTAPKKTPTKQKGNSKNSNKNPFLEKIDKLEVFSNFSDNQIRNTQISVFLAAIWQLINVDEKITEEESSQFIEFAKEMSNKYVGDDNDRNNPIIGELMKDPDKMIDVMKTFPRDELEFFWDTLFSFAMVDGEFSIEEANLIGLIASGVYEDLSTDEIKEWMQNKLSKK